MEKEVDPSGSGNGDMTNLDGGFTSRKVQTTLKSCDLCSNYQSEHLHRVESLPPETVEELEAVLGRDLDLSMRICCDHFEPHSFARSSKNNVLVVKKEAATLAFVGRGTSSCMTIPCLVSLVR
jgi:hypothetical protein